MAACSTSSDVRKLLRSARECLQQKAYAEALQHCKEALRQDRGCYEAYVFVGKAAFHLKEYQQAEAAYQRAAELDPSNHLAWQGLAELHTETGAWASAANDYGQLAFIAQTSGDSGMQAKAPTFERRRAEACGRGGLLDQAEQAWWGLLEKAEAPAERLELLCCLADVQLDADERELAARVQARLQEAALAGIEISEAAARQVVEGEWGEEAIELEADHACATLKEIITLAPPSPRYARYYDAYMLRLRKAIYAAPQGSMERHSRRAALLRFAMSTMEGRSGTGVPGGCCSAYPFEAALAMLELEGDVVGSQATAPASAAVALLQGDVWGTDGVVVGGACEVPVLLAEVEGVAVRLAHSFPWSPTATTHLALCRQRRSPARQQAPPPAAAAGAGVTWLGGAAAPPPGRVVRLSSGARRKAAIKDLLLGLRRGCASCAGWLAASELLLQEGAAEAALDAAKEGLKHLAARDLLGKERMQQAELQLQLAAGRALVAMGALQEAEALLVGLQARVSEGRATYGELAGLPPVSISQQATRLLAQVSLARGDRVHARQLYEGLVGRDLMGRSSVRAEHWAHAEYGWMLVEEGALEAARHHLELALSELLSLSPLEAPDDRDALVATYRLRLGSVCWDLGGVYRESRGAHAQAHLLAAAAAAEGQPQTQAAAFALLGRWYAEVAADEARARKCFQRAVALDASQAAAGEALVALLRAAGQSDVARGLCEETLTRDPHGAGTQWARRLLASLQLESGNLAGAVEAHQSAIRSEPDSAPLWEGLGAAYHQLGRLTAALKSYGRALELEPGRLYCLLQSGALQYAQGDYGAALTAYQTALRHEPTHPVALLGAAEALLASAHVHTHMGASGIAAVELEQAAAHAQLCAQHHAHMQAAWKLLGDAQLQHAAVTPRQQLQQLAAAATGDTAAAAALAGMKARVECVRAARRAYAHALHLDPSQGLVWGDAATTHHQEAAIRRLHPDLQPEKAKQLLSAGDRLVRGGLRLEPTSDWLWAAAGNIASADATAPDSKSKEAAAARAEYCWSRALQLNPKRAVTWAALGRMYATNGAGPLAQRCFEQCRSHDPTLAAVWENMGAMEGATSQVTGDAGFRAMIDAYEHAMSLGGAAESRLGYAAAALMAGRGGQGEVYAAAAKCVAQLPLLAAAHNALGLAAEARGHAAEAARAFTCSLELLNQQQQQQRDGACPGVLGTSTWCALPQRLDPQAAAGGASASLLARAVRLNLARSLVKSERWSEGAEAYGKLRDEGAMAQDPAAWVGLAHALAKLGKSDAATTALQSAVAAAVAAEAGALESPAAAAAAPAAGGWRGSVRLSAALALARHLLSCGKVQEAHGVVVEHCGSVPAGDAQAAALAAQLWLAVLAGATVDPRSQSAITMLEDSLRSWLQGQPLVDQAEVLAHVHGLRARRHASAGNATAARVGASKATHLCPWDARCRLQLAAAAAAASPLQAAAAARVAPIVPLAPHVPGNPATRRHIPLSASFLPRHASPQADLPAVAAAAAAAAPSLQAPPTTIPWPEAAYDITFGPVSLYALREVVADTAVNRQAVASHATRTAGLLSQMPTSALAPLYEAEVRRLTSAVHMEPGSETTWYLLALVSVQHAVASGGQCRLFRQALVRCRLAVARAQRVFARAQEHATAAAAAAAPVPAAPAPPVLPIMAIYAAANKRAAAGGSAASAPASPAAAGSGAATAAAARDELAVMVLRLLALISECHLHSRLPGCAQRAKDVATDALRWGLQQNLDPSLAHRQLGRVAAAVNDTGNAELSLSQAVKAGDLPALLELCSVLQDAGQPAAAAQALTAGLQAKAAAGGAAPWESALLSAARVAEVLPLMQLGELEQAKAAAAAVGADPAAAAAPAALVLQASAALRLASPEAGAEGGAPEGEVAKKLVLEARWAASSAIKALQGPTRTVVLPPAADRQEGVSMGTSAAGAGAAVIARPRDSSTAALAQVMLSQAEAARNKGDKALAAMQQALQQWPDPAKAALLDQLAQLQAAAPAAASTGGVPSARSALACAVHVQPWDAAAWKQLRGAAPVASAW